MGLTPGYRGRPLETTVIASQGRFIRVRKMSAATRWLRGGKQIVMKGPVDYVGTVCKVGRSICFDAKMCDLAQSFPIGNREHFPAHQRDYLIEQGEAGAVAGLLIEATAIRKLLWLNWNHLRNDLRKSILWTDPNFFFLGDTLHTIRFGDLLKHLGISTEAAA